MSALMNPEIKELWIAALESGEYEQCKGRLTRIDSEGKKTHCCLGVLSELGVKAGITTAPDIIGFGGGGYVEYEDGVYGPASSITPDLVANWAGLDENNPRVTIDGTIRSLADLNDSGVADDENGDSIPFTFPQIAAIIREQL